MAQKPAVTYLDHLTEPDVVRYRHTIELNVAAHDSEESLQAVEALVRAIAESDALPASLVVHSYTAARPVPNDLEEHER